MSIVLSPRISEQTFAQSANNVYVFTVDPTANRNEVKAEIERQFDVTVTKINAAIVKGKKKASNRKRVRPVYGNRKDVKKVYVTLKEGDKISLFEDLQ